MHDTAFFQEHDLGGYLGDLFEQMPGFLYFVKDVNLRIVACNKRLAEKVQLEAHDSLLGLTDYDYLPAHLADSYKEDDLHVLETGKPIVDKVELVTRGNGLVDWSTTTKTPLKSNDGRIVGVMGVTRPFQGGVSGVQANSELGTALQEMQHRFADNVPVTELARMSHMSVSSFERKFKKCFGMTPKLYMRHLRVQEACHMLVQTIKTLAEIAMDCGFADQSHLTREFSKIINESPRQYRQRFHV